MNTAPIDYKRQYEEAVATTKSAVNSNTERAKQKSLELYNAEQDIKKLEEDLKITSKTADDLRMELRDLSMVIAMARQMNTLLNKNEGGTGQDGKENQSDI